MNYKVLYRKYRPTTFNEVIGQKTVVQLLKDGIMNDKISHAYIFSGPRGTGKTSTAKIFAKAINCLSPCDGDPCNNCNSCKEIKHNSDIYEIDAASNTGVDQMRELIDNIKLSPINSKYKVYIIDEVHMLSSSAFNALLLTLEEPPSHVVFILATTNIESVPITVLSRCQRLDFKKITNNYIISALKEIALKEKIDITDEALSEIATFSDGGLRDALSILDQLSKLNQKITEKTVLETIGLVTIESVEKLIDHINTGEVKEIIHFFNELRESSADFKSIVKKIIDVTKTRAIACKMNNNKDMLDYNDYKTMCFEVASCLYKINVNIDSYTLLELTLLDFVKTASNENQELKQNYFPGNNFEQKYLDNNTDCSNNVVEKQLKPKENENNKIENNYFPGNNFNIENIRINNCFVSANKKILQENKINWQEYIKNTKNKKIKGMILDTELVLCSPDVMVLLVDISEKADIINSNLKYIEDNYNKINNTNFKIISTFSNNWNKITQNYRENLKKGINYEYIDENKENEITDVVDIFHKDKIEVK